MEVLSIGEFSMVLSAMLLFIGTINQVGNVLVGIGEKGQYIEAVRIFLEEHEMNRKKELANEVLVQISFSNVSFAYPGSNFYAVKNLNLELQWEKSMV